MLLLFILSFAPGALWVWFFYRQDRLPEPFPLIARTFLWGMVWVLPAILVESLYPGPLRSSNGLTLFLATVLGVGLVEEAAKLMAVRFSVWHEGAFDEPVDGIIYAITAALGFAALENLLYGLRFGTAVVPLRALVTLLAHASFSGIAGFGLTQYRFGGKSFFPQLLLAAFLHGSYNFLLASNLPNYFGLLLIAGSYLYLRQLLVRTQGERL